MEFDMAQICAMIGGSGGSGEEPGWGATALRQFIDNLIMVRDPCRMRGDTPQIRGRPQSPCGRPTAKGCGMGHKTVRCRGKLRVNARKCA